MNTMDYTGKRVVITGCSSGIGFAAAQALIEAGAVVTGMSRRKPDLPLAAFHSLDLTSERSIDEASAVIDGRIDALFNCAGAPPTVPSADLVKVNFLGPRLLTQHLTQHMGSGSAIVNISSSAGSGWRARVPLLHEFLSISSFADGADWYEANEQLAGHGYLFSKEAVSAWTMFASTSLIVRGIRMNSTSPGAVRTPLLDAAAAAFPPELLAMNERPIGRASEVDEQVMPLLFLNSPEASYINGAELAVDGGHQALQIFAQHN